MKTVLLAVDIQNGIVTEKLYNKDAVISNIKSLIECCRENDVEVIYVRHIDSELVEGDFDWQIYSDIAPKDGEKVINKTVSSAFSGSWLKGYLDDNGVTQVIIVGLLTDYCIDANVKTAFEHGYKVIIPENTNSTFSNEYLTAKELVSYYNDNIWNKRFASIKPIEEVKKIINDKTEDK